MNGQYSERFDVRRGMWRWSSVSVFIPYWCWKCILNDTSEQEHLWYKILDEEVLLSQCADDIAFSFLFSQRFAWISRLKINRGKSVAVWIGSQRNSQVNFMSDLIEILCHFWILHRSKVLGVMSSTDLPETVTVHFENKLNEMRKFFNAWSRRNFTLFGKIIVIKL